MFNEIESLSYHNKEVKFYTPTKKTAGRVKKIFRKLNSGVGAAVKDGYRLSLSDGNDITVMMAREAICVSSG